MKDGSQNVKILYVNWKNETSWRNIRPISLEYASNEYHLVSQWLLVAWDNDKNAERKFAILDIKEWVVDKD